MKILLVSGLNAPPDGNGLLDLRDKIFYNSPIMGKLLKWTDPLEPADHYFGHSYGFAAIMKYLAEHPEITPGIVGSLEGVPNWDFKQYQWKEWIRPNCKQFVSYRRVVIFPPWSSGIKNPEPGDIDKTYFWATHNSIPRDPAIHAEIVGLVKGFV